MEYLYPKAVKCIEEDLDELLTFFHFDESHRIKIRTTDPIERAFKEFRRGTNVMDNHLHNMSTCEKIFYIMLKFLNERWSDKTWLIFESIEKIPNHLRERRFMDSCPRFRGDRPPLSRGSLSRADVIPA